MSVDVPQLLRVLEALSLTGDQELTCAGLDDDSLAAYADLELAGHDPGSHMPGVRRHLSLCPDCRRDYRELVTMLRLQQTGEWMEPETVPALDLSFLPIQPDVSEPWFQVAERVRRFAFGIPVLLLGELDRLGRLPAGLQLSPVASTPSRMRGRESDTPVVAFRLTDARGHFAADLRFRCAGEDVVWIGVRPLNAESEAPLAGAVVALHSGDGRLLEVRTAPSDGVTQLRDVPLDREFRLRIEHGGNAWDIPFSLHVEQPGAEEGDRVKRKT